MFFKKIQEIRSLILLRISLTKYNCMEYAKVIRYYYPKLSFAITDLSLLSLYLFSNPFRMVRRFFAKQDPLRNSDSPPYGETPLTTMQYIAQKAEITKNDTVLELGSGRGRACFWLQAFIGCTVVGIEIVPGFVMRARQIVSWRRMKNLSFCLEDMFLTNLCQASVIYLYGTCLSDEEIKKIIINMNKVSSQTKIITISYPLADYAIPKKKKQETITSFKVIKTFSVSFPWGETEAYVQVVKK